MSNSREFSGDHSMLRDWACQCRTASDSHNVINGKCLPPSSDASSLAPESMHAGPFRPPENNFRSFIVFSDRWEIQCFSTRHFHSSATWSTNLIYFLLLILAPRSLILPEFRIAFQLSLVRVWEGERAKIVFFQQEPDSYYKKRNVWN